MWGRRYTKCEKEQIIALYNAGVSLIKLSKRYKIEVQTLRLWVKRFRRIKLNKSEVITIAEINRLKENIILEKRKNKILKKAHEHILNNKHINKKKIKFINKNKTVYSIKTMCRILNINRSTFYKNINRKQTKREKQNKILEKTIYNICGKNKKKYAVIEIKNILSKKGYNISLKKVKKFMEKMKLYLYKRKTYKYSRKKYYNKEFPNILNRNFKTNNINEKCLGDITYIYIKTRGWCYLASVLELHTRKIIGYSIGKNMTTDLAIKSLERACRGKKSLNGLIFHSDLGSQYTSHKFKEYCDKMGIIQSYSKKGCPYDNAPMEAFHSILKKEEVYLKNYSTFREVCMNLYKFIENWYNKKRIHSSINYMTPDELENLIKSNNC